MATVEQVSEQMLERRLFDPKTDEFQYVPGHGLPAAKYWVNLEQEPEATPTDPYGFVDIDKLIGVVKARVKPEYRWMPPTNIHHLYWPEDDYATTQRQNPDILSYRFREIAPNKIRVPLIFHRMIHIATLPPPMPSPEQMALRVETWGIAQDLFNSIKKFSHEDRVYQRRLDKIKLATQDDPLVELDASGREIVDARLIRHFHGVALHLGRLSTIPPEYWPFRSDVTAQIAAGEIGDLVLRQSMRRVKKVLRVELENVA